MNKAVAAFVIVLIAAVCAETQENKDVLKGLAEYACKTENCFPFMPSVCPFQFLCQTYCKEQQKEGACNNGTCDCFELNR